MPVIQIPFPIKGYNKNQSFDRQPPETSSYMINVRAYEQYNNRARLGSAPSFPSTDARSYSDSFTAFGVTSSAAETAWATETSLSGPDLIALYHGRVVIAKGTHFWASRVGDPEDWAVAANDAGSPYDSTVGAAGEPPEDIVALIPFSDDYMVIGCEDSMWVMRGDPSWGGSVDQLTNRDGILGPQAWCIDFKNDLYFAGKNGFYMIPKGLGGLQNIGTEQVPGIFLDGTTDVELRYDEENLGIAIIKNAGLNGLPEFDAWSAGAYDAFSTVSKGESFYRCSIRRDEFSLTCANGAKTTPAVTQQLQQAATGALVTVESVTVSDDPATTTITGYVRSGVLDETEITSIVSSPDVQFTPTEGSLEVTASCPKCILEPGSEETLVALKSSELLTNLTALKSSTAVDTGEATAPEVGITLTQATSNATMVVKAVSTDKKTVYGVATGTFNTTNEVTGAGGVSFIPDDGVADSIAPSNGDVLTQAGSGAVATAKYAEDYNAYGKVTSGTFAKSSTNLITSADGDTFFFADTSTLTGGEQWDTTTLVSAQDAPFSDYFYDLRTQGFFPGSGGKGLVLIGPVQLGNDDFSKGKVTELTFSMGHCSSLPYYIYVANSALELRTKMARGDAAASSGTISSEGRNEVIRPNVIGAYMAILLGPGYFAGECIEANVTPVGELAVTSGRKTVLSGEYGIVGNEATVYGPIGMGGRYFNKGILKRLDVTLSTAIETVCSVYVGNSAAEVENRVAAGSTADYTATFTKAIGRKHTIYPRRSGEFFALKFDEDNIDAIAAEVMPAGRARI